jgi:hypothetical protein
MTSTIKQHLGRASLATSGDTWQLRRAAAAW